MQSIKAFAGAASIGMAAASSSISNVAGVAPANLPSTPYYKWAHGHWVWNHNSAVNQQNTTGIVQEYLDHGIPVSAVNIDSTWATQYNNFQPNPDKFPDFKGMVSELHAQNVKVLLWATSMVNVENPDYQFCVDNQYLVRDSKGFVRPLGWWHGEGGLLDYSNPDAVSWWHSKMDIVLDAGLLLHYYVFGIFVHDISLFVRFNSIFLLYRRRRLEARRHRSLYNRIYLRRWCTWLPERFTNLPGLCKLLLPRFSVLYPRKERWFGIDYEPTC